MVLNDTVDLVGVARTQDADGYAVDTETVATVKCDSGNGVTRAEFYAAAKAGVRLSAVFELWACDYSGQPLLRHGGKTYRVERAYPMGDGVMQLNCSEVT